MNTTFTIINDCRDANATGRQIARVTSLFGKPVNFIGVSNDLEASGNIIDVIDAMLENPGVILANVAPRNGEAKKWSNGTPFAYFWYQNKLVISSVGGLTLSLVKKLKLVESVNLLDIKDVLKNEEAEAGGMKPPGESVSESQFRSFEFLPRAAKIILQKRNIHSECLPIDAIPDIPPAIWWTDNFGNCKTTLLKKDPGIDNKKIKTHFGVLQRYSQLKNVPDKELALIEGSSGLGKTRFLEIVIQGDNASRHLNIKTGDLIF